jgi:hypothetical protein
MHTHCHRCGGFIATPGGTTYREPSVVTPVAIPHSALCLCEHALIYGSSPQAERERQLRGVHQIRSASRN